MGTFKTCINRLVLISLGFLLFHCGTSNSVKVPSEPFQKLSQYGFFKDELKDLKPNKGVVPYDVITPLFSDYAEKARFVWMPPGTSALIEDEKETFVFPERAVLIKNFYYPHDARDLSGDKQIIETRLLIQRKHKWDALTYVWNEDQTEAFLEIAGDLRDLSWIDLEGRARQVSFMIPNKNQCKGCHEYNKQLQPIGPKIRYLNKSYPYADGSKNQLTKWREVGYLKELPGEPSELSQVAFWDNDQELLEDRALAYMEVNCGICHSEPGPAAVSGLFLTTFETNPNHLGICKSPVSAGSGSGGRSFDIVPGKPEASILMYRMESLDPGEMMPELGRSVVHKEGVQLIKEWITSLHGDCRESL